MNLLLFWLKIAGKRTAAFIKQSPVLVAGTLIIIFSIIAAGIDTALRPDTAKCITLLSLLTLISLIASLKQYHVTPVLLLYAKSSRPRKTILLMFFVKKACTHNIPLLLCNIITLTGLIQVEQYIHVLLFTLFSLSCSLLAIIVKNTQAHKRTSTMKTQKTHINVRIKSMIYDYLTHDFFLCASIAISLFIVIFMEMAKEKTALPSQNSQAFILAGLAAVLSFGFSGIIDSIPHINWKYYAVVSPQGFFHHFRKTAIFLLCFFGLFIAIFIISGLFINPGFMLICFYCMAFMFISSINIAFTSTGMITKAALFMAAMTLSLWAGFMRSYVMPLLLVPALAGLATAKSGCREWYIL
jgi:hypothetical protein